MTYSADLRKQIRVNKYNSIYSRRRWIIAAVFVPWVLFLPLLSIIGGHGFNLREMPELFSVLFRTVAVAGLTAILGVILGLVFAFVCRRVRHSVGESFALLLLPTLAGGLFWGFIGKVFVFRFGFLAHFIASRSVGATLSFILVLYLLQYGTLAGYILWLRARTIPPSALAYARTAGLSRIEVASDIFWPHCRSLALALVFFVFLICATESATTDLAIQPSVGTGTATLAHWIFEQYRIWFPASPRIAAGQVGTYGLFGGTVILASAALVGLVFITSADWLTRMGRSTRRSESLIRSRVQHEERASMSADILGIVAVCLVFLPVAISYFVFPPHVPSDASELIGATLWTLPVAVASFLVSSVLALLIRLWLTPERVNASIDKLGLYLLMLHPLAFPALIFSTSVLWWFGVISSVGISAVTISWACGHVLRAMPLLLCFTFWTYSRIARAELEYQQLAGIRLRELVKVTFWDRLRQDYLLLLLFAWALAWNDSVINRAAASQIPSLYVLLSPKLSVRPDYHGAQFCLLASVVIGIAITVLWRNVTNRIAGVD